MGLPDSGLILLTHQLATGLCCISGALGGTLSFFHCFIGGSLSLSRLATCFLSCGIVISHADPYLSLSGRAASWRVSDSNGVSEL
jgi:hypothetical protein